MNQKTQLSPVTPRDEMRLSETELEHEARIKRLGELMMEKYMAWARSGCFAARGELDAAWLNLKAAIGQRSPAVVKLMEVQRGLV